MIIGYIGLGLLVISYFLLNSKYSNWFIKVDTIASILLTIHAVMIRDIPFILVNGFIVIMLIIKWKNGGIK